MQRLDNFEESLNRMVAIDETDDYYIGDKAAEGIFDPGVKEKPFVALGPRRRRVPW